MVGAGPVGALMASELTRRGVDVAVVERRTGLATGSRAIGLHAPVLAALEGSGVTARMLESAHRVRVGHARRNGDLLGSVRFDRLSTRFPFVATLPQHQTHRALSADAPTPIAGLVTGVRSGPVPRVRYRTADGEAAELSCRIVVIAGGARARDLVYRAGALAERPAGRRYLMADVPGEGGAEAVVDLNPWGALESFPLPGGIRRFVAPADAPADPSPTGRGAQLRRLLSAHGMAHAAQAVTEAAEFRIRRAIAPALRHASVIAIGDTAHEISPMGGQGMNLGLLDAVTLAPLVAEWVRTGTAPDAELRAWEHRRIRSARTADRIAAANTSLGSPTGPVGDAARRIGLRVALRGRSARAVAHAYAMGWDRDARQPGDRALRS